MNKELEHWKASTSIRPGLMWTASTVLLVVIQLGFAVKTARSQDTESQTPPTYRVLYTFTGGTDGAWPGGGGLGSAAGLVRDEEGNLYGTASYGGANVSLYGGGVVFKVDRNGKQTVLHTFVDAPDGAVPYGGLIRDAEGNLYGTTSFGGQSESGTVFKINREGEETVLYSFTGADGSSPYSNIVRDKQGSLYGTTTGGGLYGYGVIFKLDSSGRETVLYSFTGGVDGAQPGSELLRDEGGNFYGTTMFGGSQACNQGCGVVFKLNSDRKLEVLHSFTGGLDGSVPFAGLVGDEDGNLYGTTAQGGLEGCLGFGCGVLFKLDRRGRVTVLHSFTGVTDGGFPRMQLIRSAGNLYGETFLSVGADGSCCGFGTIFKLNGSGEFSILYTFAGGVEGGIPSQGMTMDNEGNLYGTTSVGGDVTSPEASCEGEGCGVVFKLTSTTAGVSP